MLEQMNETRSGFIIDKQLSWRAIVAGLTAETEHLTPTVSTILIVTAITAIKRGET